MHPGLAFRIADWGVDTQCRYLYMESHVTENSSIVVKVPGASHIVVFFQTLVRAVHSLRHPPLTQHLCLADRIQLWPVAVTA